MSEDRQAGDELAITDEPLVRVRLGPDEKPIGAFGHMRIDAPPERVWSIVSDVDRYPERVPMIHKAHADGDRVTMQLRFKVALFSAKFGFTSRMITEGERRLDLQYVSGEPADIQLRFDLEPLDEGRATLLRTAVAFDIQSLGWLVKFFLRHHPEIQFGVFPGTTVVLLDSIRRAARQP